MACLNVSFLAGKASAELTQLIFGGLSGSRIAAFPVSLKILRDKSKDRCGDLWLDMLYHRNIYTSQPLGGPKGVPVPPSTKTSDPDSVTTFNDILGGDKSDDDFVAEANDDCSGYNDDALQGDVHSQH
jgi:hypothetical protein